MEFLLAFILRLKARRARTAAKPARTMTFREWADLPHHHPCRNGD